MKTAVFVVVLSCLVAMTMAAAMRPMALNRATLVNDEALIKRVNGDVSRNWKAKAHSRFEGMTLADARRMLGLNMDLNDEVVQTMKTVSHADLLTDIPDTFDARQTWPGYIHPIRDQGQCGSCWAVSISEVLSDRFAIATNGSVNVILSPEDLVSCDSGDMGCQGGYLPNAWNYLRDTGIVTESCFPYTAGSGVAAQCIDQCEDGSQWTKYKSQTYARFATVEDVQKEIMTNGPVQAGFLVYKDFMTYSSGVYKKTWYDLKPLGGHAVKILGWGVENSEPYWLVANSWNTTWGEQGFFKILRGKNECEIESQIVAGVPAL